MSCQEHVDSITPLALKHADLEHRLKDLAHHWDKKGFPSDASCYTLAAKFILELRAAVINGGGQEWYPIETAPKDEMFIYAAPNGPGKWSIGLAYPNVSGGWSCAYGSAAPATATKWTRLPAPPTEVARQSQQPWQEDH